MAHAHDHHTHVTMAAVFRQGVSLTGVRDRAAALDRLRSLPADRLSLVTGFSPDRHATADRLPPLVVCHRSLHGFWLNAPGQELLPAADRELLEGLADPRWTDRNLPAVFRWLAKRFPPAAADLAATLDELAGLGLARHDDLLVPAAGLLRLAGDAIRSGRLRAFVAPELWAELAPADRDLVHGLKLFADGALGTRSAALAGDYRDRPRVAPLWSDAELADRIAAAAATGKPLAIHAIGDAALDQVIRLLEELRPSVPVRLEHCQFITLGQARRAKALGLTLSMQPNFSDDSADYADRLTDPQRAGNNPLRMLIDEVGFVPGRDLLLGSDGMPAGLEPARRSAFEPPFPGQRLTEAEFAVGYALTANR